MTNPSHYKYSRAHLWLSIEGDIATVGITEYGQSELGSIEFIEIQNDLLLVYDDAFGSIESAQTTTKLYIPLTGKVLQVNEKVRDTPRIINDDPYGEGWLIKIQVSDMNQITWLLSVNEYEAYIEQLIS
jgi:glycine cleavage system H protein